MNILLAHSDRDFLQCYQKLLTMDSHTVTTVFDGAQAIFRLGGEKYDIAVLEERLPRIELMQFLQILEKVQTPEIVLTNNRVTVKTLLSPVLPNAVLAFPFLPADLTGLIQSVIEKKRSHETLTRCGIEVDVTGFCFSGSDIRLTNGEIDLLRELANPVRSAGKRKRVAIQALNEKMKALGKQTQIVYELERDYRLVNGND